MGIVYSAVHVRLKVPRAIKVLTDEAAADSSFRARFERESQLAASLEHPNVVSVHEAGEVDGVLYISMRYVDGPNLSQKLASGPLPVGEVAHLVTELARALDAAHDQGLVHRDVKPANVLIEDRHERELVFLSDFGISRMLLQPETLTETGEMLGTVDYVAPEQIAGQPVDGRADVYSLACLAYEALAGNAPFVRETQLATMFAHANDPRPAPSAVRSNLPASVDRVFEQALAVDPRGRYSQASEFADQFERALAGERIAIRADRSWTLRHRGFTAAAAGIVAAGLAAGALAAAGVFDGSGGGSGGSAEPRAAQGGGSPAAGSQAGGPQSGNSSRPPLPPSVNAPPAKAEATIDVVSDPTALAVGELNVWVASPSAGAISSIAPYDSDVAQPPVPVEGSPTAIAGAFASIWAVDRTGNALLRLDPGEGKAPVRIPVGASPSDVAVGSASLWVTNQADDTASRIDPGSNQVDRTVDVGDAPTSVAVGEDAIWVAGSDGVTEIDPTTGESKGSLVQLPGNPTGIAAGEGGVWVADPPNRRVVRVDPQTRAVDKIGMGARVPSSVAAAYGYVWVTLGDGEVVRIEPQSDRLAGKPIPVGESPTDIAADKGFVWTANRGDSTVTRIAPTG
jgi:YVTN family beta-propeller protein